jgi:plastocyanin
MTRRLAALVLFAVGLLAVPVPAFAATATVTIGATLSPRSLSVRVGTTVTWRNADSDRHRVRTTSAPVELDSNDLERGESWSFTFRAAGTYRYVDHREEDDPAYWGTVTVSTPAPPESRGASGGGGATAPASGSVTIAGRAFSPSSVTVRAGGTITFANDDDRAHTVTARDGSFDSGVLGSGARWARRFASAGTFRYFCAIHPEMTGLVTVPTSSGSVPPPAPAARPRPAPVPAPAPGPGPGGGGGAGVAGPSTVRVDVVDFAFAPGRASARVGDTVTWVNAGRSPHTVTASGGPFGTAMLPAGATYRWVPARTGTWSYVCAFHPGMTGTVAVLPRSAALPRNVAAAAPAPRPRETAGVTSPAASAPPPVDAVGAATASGRPSRAIRETPAASASPLVAWSLWSVAGLAVFLALAWWRGREVADPRG